MYRLAYLRSRSRSMSTDSLRMVTRRKRSMPVISVVVGPAFVLHFFELAWLEER